MQKQKVCTRKYIEECWQKVFWTDACRKRYGRKLVRLYGNRTYTDGLPIRKMIRLCVYAMFLMTADTVLYLTEKKERR